MCEYIGVRYILPGEAEFRSSSDGSLTVIFPGESPYEQVQAFNAFPLTFPQQFISLRVGEAKGQDVELGVIENLHEFPVNDRKLIEQELRKRYFVYKVLKINSLQEDMGWLYWSVATDKGTREFSFPRWRQSCVQDIRGNGKVIYDYDKNRYEIDDMTKLDKYSRQLFYRYVYW
jgi:hypothetical protein